jgi:hypothetical protein
MEKPPKERTGVRIKGVFFTICENGWIFGRLKEAQE